MKSADFIEKQKIGRFLYTDKISYQPIFYER